MSKRTWRRSVVLLLLLSILPGLLPMDPAVVFAAFPDCCTLEDQYLRVSTNTGNGRFAISTTGGDQFRPTDDETSVLYEQDYPETSFTSFNIDGDEVIYGHTYGGIAPYSYFLQAPEVQGNLCVSVWKYKDVEITQTIELLTAGAEFSFGNAKVSYAIKNGGGSVVQVGTRVLLDIKTGENDGALLLKAGEATPVRGERLLTGEDIPLYWTSMDDFSDPKVMSYGMLYGWGDAKPSKVIFGHWSGLSASKWEYEADEWVDYTTSDNRFSSADSAVAVYWEDVPLPAGETQTFTTLVGMGDLEAKELTLGGLAINFTAPPKVLLQNGADTQFEITAEIDNTLENSVDQSGLRVELSYPVSCALVEGNQLTDVQQLSAGTKLPVKWKFRPISLESVNVYQFIVSVQSGADVLKTGSVYVVAMPSFSELQAIQYNTVTPTEMYKGEELRKVSIRGNNFNWLRDDPDKWQVYVKEQSSGLETPVNSADVDIVSNQEMYIFLPDGLALGNYGLGIRHELLANSFYRENAFAITTNTKVIRRAYGQLLITRKERTEFGENNKEFVHLDNYIRYFSGNDSVVIPAGEKEVLRITGNIQQVDTNKYSVIPSEQTSVYLGKLLRLTGETDANTGKKAELTIELRHLDHQDGWGNDLCDEGQTQAYIKGNDQCRIYLDTPALKIGSWQVTEAAAKPRIWSKAFELNVNDFVIKKPNLLGLSDETTANIAGFLLGIKEMRVKYVADKAKYAVEIKASLDMTKILSYLFQYLAPKEEQQFLTFVDIQVDNFRVYEDGTIDFKTAFSVRLPKLKIGPMLTDAGLAAKENQTGNIYGKVSIDTIEDVFSIEASLGLPNLSSFTGDLDVKSTTAGIKGKIGVFAIQTPLWPIFLPDTIEAQFNDTFGFISIPDIPVAINQIGGGIYDLHALRDAGNAYPDFSGKFWFGITDTFSPILMSKRMLSATDCTISVGSKELALSGTGYVYTVPLAKAEGKIMYYPKLGYYVGGELNLLDIIVAEASAEVSYNYLLNRFYAGGHLRGYVQIPKYSPVLPGLKFYDAVGALSTDQALLYYSLPIIGAKLGIRYQWATQKTEFWLGTTEPVKSGLQSGALVDTDGNRLAVGVNLQSVPVTRVQSGLMSTEPVLSIEHLGAVPQLRAQTLTYTSTFVSNGQADLLVQAEYPQGENILPVTITDPAGHDYPVLVDGPNQNVLFSEYEDPETHETKSYIAISIPAASNQSGTWTVQSGTDADFEVYGAPVTSNISGVTAERQDDGSYLVTVSLDRAVAELTSQVDLFLDSSQGESTRTQLLLDGQALTGQTGTYRVTLPTTVEDGDYRITAALNQYDASNQQVGYSQGQTEEFNVVNPNNPPAPTGLTVQAIGSGQLQVEWDQVNSPDIAGYYVGAYDPSGQPLADLQPIWVSAQPGLKRYSTVIGAWPTGVNYRVAVQAVRETAGAPVEDNQLYLPSPYAKLTPLGSGDQYQAVWQVIPDYSEYVLVVDDGQGQQISIPYLDDGTDWITTENDQGEEISALALDLSSLTPKTEYGLSVYGIKAEDLSANGVTVTDATSTSKTISWDKVETANLRSYMIVATPHDVALDRADYPIITQECPVTAQPQPESYSVAIDGFQEGIAYDVSVTAVKQRGQIAVSYFSRLSSFATVDLPTPHPPEWNISCRPADSAGNGVVQVLLDGEQPYFTSNVRNVTLIFESDAAKQSSLYVNDALVQTPTGADSYAGKAWSATIELEEGANDVRILTENSVGDTASKDYQFVCKTAAPTLLLDEPTAANGQFSISGITDSGCTVQVNNVPVSVDASGRFSCQLPSGQKAVVDYVVTSADCYQNKSTYHGQVADSSIQGISGLEISLAERMNEGSTQKLRLLASDQQGNAVEVANDLVHWTVIEGTRNASLVDGKYVSAVRRGQFVLAAEYHVNQETVLTTACVVTVDAAHAPPEPLTAYLTNLQLSAGTVRPAYSPDVFDYTASVPYQVAAVSVVAITDLEDAAIRVNGETVASGDDSNQIQLQVGNNQIAVTVTAAGMQEATYTLRVQRNAPVPPPDDDDDAKPDQPVNPGQPNQPGGPTGPGKPSGVLETQLSADESTVFLRLSLNDQAQLDAARMAELLALAQQAAAVKRAAVLVIASADSGAEEVEVPSDLLRQLSLLPEAALAITSESGTVVFDAQAMGNMAAAAGTQSVRVRLAQVDPASLPPAERGLIDGQSLYRLSVSAGLSQISGFGAGQVEVYIPYALRSGERRECVVVQSLQDDGQLHPVVNQYDPARGSVGFRTRGPLQFVVSCANATCTGNSANAWYATAVNFVGARGVAVSPGGGPFDSHAPLSRGQCITMIMQAYGIAPSASGETFSDAGDAYYTPYLAAAKQLRLVGGVGNNQFQPEREITRQEMATMLYNALQTLGALPAGVTGQPTTGFRDAGRVATWAKQSMGFFTANKLIGGCGDGMLLPAGPASITQLAELLYRLLSGSNSLSYWELPSGVE